MPFCYAPWTNVDISPQGQIGPCCKFRHEYYRPPLQIQNSTLDEYLANPVLEEIKENFRKDQWPKGCERCRIEEENNIPSKRQLDQDRWQRYYDDHDLSHNTFLTASVAFGNTCNLKCITCSPHSSSRWQQEYKDLFGKDVIPNHFYKQGFVEEFVNCLPNLIHLDIPGGEPFLSGVQQQQDLLEKYRHRANLIELHYTTNATLFPDLTWWNLWKNFKEIDLQISLDAIDKRLEYIRFPAHWKEILSNINRYLEKASCLENLRLSLSVTVSAYNIAYLDELLDWCESVNLPKPWLGKVHTPIHLRPSIWPNSAKDFIIERLRTSRHQDLHRWADMIQSIDDSRHFEMFKIMTLKYDQYRGTNFFQIFPEMAKFL